jgi:hypothetical protein
MEPTNIKIKRHLKGENVFTKTSLAIASGQLLMSFNITITFCCDP